jgi:hypothetical protein
MRKELVWNTQRADARTVVEIGSSKQAIESCDHGLPQRVTDKPEGILILCPARRTLTVKSSNLQRVGQAVTKGRVRFIQEGTEAEHGLKAEDAAHIERILIQPDGEDALSHTRKCERSMAESFRCL